MKIKKCSHFWVKIERDKVFYDLVQEYVCLNCGISRGVWNGKVVVHNMDTGDWENLSSPSPFKKEV